MEKVLLTTTQTLRGTEEKTDGSDYIKAKILYTMRNNPTQSSMTNGNLEQNNFNTQNSKA